MKKLYVMVILLLVSAYLAKSQIYVTVSGAGNNDGASWANAYDKTKLQRAINESATALTKEVRLGAGTYNTGSIDVNDLEQRLLAAGDPRDRAYVMRAGVRLKGGYPTTGGDESSRNFTSNETTLSADIVGDDGNLALPNRFKENSYHIIISLADGVGAGLDGFTITGGYADGTAGINTNAANTDLIINRNVGGAICIRGNDNNISYSNLKITNNYALGNGGAVWIRAAQTPSGNQEDLTIRTGLYPFTNVEFRNNISGNNGGAFYFYPSSGNPNLFFIDCNFTENQAVAAAGGLYINQTAGNPKAFLRNSVFHKNTAGTSGGALYFYPSTGAPQLIISNNSRFSQNTSTAGTYGGGAVLVYSDNETQANNINAKVTMTDVIFEDNKSLGTENYGGGAYCHLTMTGELSNVIFRRNYSAANGGAIYYRSGISMLKNAKFFDNSAGISGGAIMGNSSTAATNDMVISQSIFVRNKALSTSGTAGGAAIHITQNSTTTLTAIGNTFFNNIANSVNGAISFNNATGTQLNLFNNIFYENYGKSGGNTILADVRDAIISPQNFANNMSFQVGISESGARSVTSWNILDSALPLFSSTIDSVTVAGNKVANPTFLRLKLGSQAIDLGNNTKALEYNILTGVEPNLSGFDLGNENRIVDGKIDLGAYEYFAPLPVKVNSFTAALINNRVQFKWNVGVEDNVAKYVIERSVNGIDFTPISNIKASGAKAYNAIDLTPQLGTNYYRLTSVDNDGTASAFENIATIKVSMLNDEKFSTYPNPVKGNIVNFNLANYPVGDYKYDLKDVTGAQINKGTINNQLGEIKINIDSPAGVYILTLTKGDITLQTKIIKH